MGKYIRVSDLNNLSWDDINRMDVEQLRKVARSSIKVSNQRLETLRGIKTPAKDALIEKQGSRLPREREIDVMNVNELKKLVRDTTRFVQSKTSKLSGERERIRNFIRLSIDKTGKTSKQIETLVTRRINQLGGYTSSKLREVWDLIEEVKELDKGLVWEVGSPTDQGPTSGLVGQVFDIYSNMNLDDAVLIHKELKNRLDKKEKDDLPFF